MEVDLRDLELLDALGDDETLTAAAERLYVSQPALSQRLTKMEQRLGTALFDRRGRRLVPNAAGRRMLVAARHVMAELDAARRDLRELQAVPGRRLRLTAQCSTVFQWLPGVIRAYRRACPGVEVRIESGAERDPLGALLDDLVDVALVTKQDPRMARVPLVPIFDDEMVAVVAADHPWARRRYVTAGDFADAHLVVYDVYDPARVPTPTLPIPHGARPARVTTMPVLPELLVEMVVSGDGVTVLPAWDAERFVGSHGVALVRMGAKPLVRTWFCATRPGPQAEHVQAFVDELVAQLHPSPGPVDAASHPSPADPGDRPAHDAAPARPPTTSARG